MSYEADYNLNPDGSSGGSDHIREYLDELMGEDVIDEEPDLADARSIARQMGATFTVDPNRNPNSLVPVAERLFDQRIAGFQDNHGDRSARERRAASRALLEKIWKDIGGQRVGEVTTQVDTPTPDDDEVLADLPPQTFTTPNGVELPRRYQRQFEYLTGQFNDYGFFARNLANLRPEINEPYNWFTNDDLPSQLDGNEEGLGVARSLARQFSGGDSDRVTSDEGKEELKNVVRQALMNLRGSPARQRQRQRNESYLYENADPSEVDFFSKEHPEMDIEEIKDILSVLLGNKPGVDKMTNIKDKAIQKLKKYFDHDD
jgi:hypothetical protein